VVNNNAVTNNINNSQNLNVYSPTHITNNINTSTNISINKPIEVYAPVTSTSNINNSSNVKITNNIDNSSNVNENLSINVTKNIAINSNNTSFTFGGSSGSHTGAAIWAAAIPQQQRLFQLIQFQFQRQLGASVGPAATGWFPFQ